jgi:hypothetical protein
MTTFFLCQQDCLRRARKNGSAGRSNFTSQIAPSICTLEVTTHDKSGATIFKSRCSRMFLCYRFYRVEALPLVRTRFLRLAKSSPMVARSPARRSRSGRAASGKTAGEMTRVLSAQFPGSSRAAADAMPPDDWPDGSQDNLLCAGAGRAMAAPETCETTRNIAAPQSAQWPRQHLAR